MGAILANTITTEAIILVACLVLLMGFGWAYEKVLVGLFITAVLFPVLFYHHSWSFWLAFDYLVESLPKYEKKK